MFTNSSWNLFDKLFSIKFNLYMHAHKNKKMLILSTSVIDKMVTHKNITALTMLTYGLLSPPHGPSVCFSPYRSRKVYSMEQTTAPSRILMASRRWGTALGSRYVPPLPPLGASVMRLTCIYIVMKMILVIFLRLALVMVNFKTLNPFI